MPRTLDQFAAIITQAAVGIARLDLHGRFTFVNDAYCRTTGHARHDLIALRLQDITHPDDRPSITASFGRCVREGRDCTIEHRYVTPSGKAVWVENSVSLLRGADGRAEAVLAVSIDITRRKTAERGLIEAGERYRLVGRATNDVIWDWDRRTDDVVFSESLARVFGYDPADAAGSIEKVIGWWGGRIHPDERPRVLASFTDMVREPGGTWAQEYRFLAADGSYRDVIDRGFIARDETGQAIRMIGSVQDVTGLLRASVEYARLHGELQAERIKLETILRQLPVGVIVADLAGRLVFANPKAEEIWHQPLRAAQSVTDYDSYKGLHPDGTPLAPHEWPLARVLATGETVAEQVIHFEDERGGRMVVVASASPLLETGGARAGAVVVFSDATDRERLLEVARLAQQDAETANQMKDEFLAVLSHELRTPLNAILGWIQMLRAGTLSEARTRHAFDVVERNAAAQARMVEDMLDVSAIIRGKLRLEMSRIDLRQVVAAEVESQRPLAAQKGIALRTELLDAPAHVIGDVSRLEQVVSNLLSNALKFTPEGGCVDVELRLPDRNRVELVVRDSGEGIDARFLPHVFDRFRQGDARPTRSHGGLGLGLSIARHLVEAHAGRITARSAGPGTGATFTMTLPRA